MKKKYFGRYPFINILVSKLIFWALDYRKNQLLKKNKKIDIQKYVLENDNNTKDVFNQYLDKGFTKLNIGGGAKNFEGFLNIDFIKHENVKNELVANVLDLSFIPDRKITQIHSNHLIEHLTKEQFVNQLKQYKRILTENGLLTLRCPNVLGVSYGFFFGQVAEQNHEEFVQLGLPKEEDFYNPLDGWYHKDLYGFYHWVWADTGNIENQHLMQFTPSTIKQLLQNSGFKILKMTEPETSNIVVIAQPT